MIQLIANAPASRAFLTWAEPNTTKVQLPTKIKNPTKKLFCTPVPKDRFGSHFLWKCHSPIFYRTRISVFCRTGISVFCGTGLPVFCRWPNGLISCTFAAEGRGRVVVQGRRVTGCPTLINRISDKDFSSETVMLIGTLSLIWRIIRWLRYITNKIPQSYVFMKIICGYQ